MDHITSHFLINVVYTTDNNINKKNKMMELNALD